MAETTIRLTHEGLPPGSRAGRAVELAVRPLAPA